MINDRRKPRRLTARDARKQIGLRTHKPCRAACMTAPTAEPEKLIRPVGGKLGVLVALLERPEGVTLEEMAQATGWKPFSVRAAMSVPLKQVRGFEISSEKADGGRIYRITGCRELAVE